MTKAKIFANGGSQAVRLPIEFRFDCDEVDVRRDTATGDIILSKPQTSWDEYFSWIATLSLPVDFLADRGQSTDDLLDPFADLAPTAIAPLKKRRA